MRSLRVAVTRDALINALQHVLKAVSANSPMPILKGIHIQAIVNGLIFTASNTSMTIQYTVPQNSSSLKVLENGGIVVPARYFHEMIRKLDDGFITLEIQEHFILTITTGSSRIRLCGMDCAEFPSMNRSENGSVHKYQMNNALLKSSIGQVTTAASVSDARPVLTGVFFEYTEHRFKLTATDGIRFASRTLHIEEHINAGINVIIPAKNLNEIAKMLNAEDEITDIEVGANQIRFIANELQIQSVLIGGAFPSVNIPQLYSSEIMMETACLLRAVERVFVLAGSSIIRLAAASGKLDISSATAEVGDVRDEVPLMERSGEDFTISLNGKLLMDILRCMDSGYVRLRFAGKMSPVVILPMDEPSSSTLFLITPVRTAN